MTRLLLSWTTLSEIINQTSVSKSSEDFDRPNKHQSGSDRAGNRATRTRGPSVPLSLPSQRDEYSASMGTVWKGHLAQTAAKYAEAAPAATTCCNACRNCVQTNLPTAALAGLVGGAALIARRFRLVTQR